MCSFFFSSHGATVEEMVVEVNKAKKDLDSAKSDLKQMISLNKVCGLLVC